MAEELVEESYKKFAKALPFSLVLVGILLLISVSFVSSFPNFSQTSLKDVSFEVLLGVGIAFVVVGITEVAVLYQHHKNLSAEVERFTALTERHYNGINQLLQQELGDKEHVQILDASDPEEYTSCWSGFDGEYFAYNASYDPEGYATMPESKLIETIYVPRYKQRLFKARYLFFVGSEDGKRQYDSFMILMKKVNSATGGSASRKVEIRKIDDKTSERPDFEFYFGTKNGVQQGLLNFVGRDAINSGVADYMFRTFNQEIMKKLQSRFNTVWEKASPISSEEFFGR